MKTKNNHPFDEHGTPIELYEQVDVPNPKKDGSDLHNHAFTGTVISIGTNYITVEDGDQNCFDIESNRLKVSI